MADASRPACAARRRRPASAVLLVVLALAAAPAVGAQQPTTRADAAAADAPVVEEHVSLSMGRQFARQRARVDMHLQPGGRFAGVSDEDRATVARLLDRMQQILDSAPAIEALEPEQRAELINVQSHVNVLLTQARADSREECRREAVVGSRFKRTICQTVAEWRRQADASQEAMRLKQVSRQRGPAGG